MSTIPGVGDHLLPRYGPEEDSLAPIPTNSDGVGAHCSSVGRPPSYTEAGLSMGAAPEPLDAAAVIRQVSEL